MYCELKESDLDGFKEKMILDERSLATIEKYIRDVKSFLTFLGGRELTRLEVLKYKEHLSDKYAVRSANSMLAALNSFLKYIGQDSLCVKQFKLQREAFSSESRELSREEYVRLVECAKEGGDEGTALLIQTICATGIRVSEIGFITVEALRAGVATVNCKGKRRRILIVKNLCKKLLKYAKMQSIVSGAVFLSPRGSAISRHTVWRKMKMICKKCGVALGKAFPHNLRHLFARSFYEKERDIVKLADVLGHASIDTTRLYVITTGAEHRRLLEGLGLLC